MYIYIQIIYLSRNPTQKQRSREHRANQGIKVPQIFSRSDTVDGMKPPGDVNHNKSWTFSEVTQGLYKVVDIVNQGFPAIFSRNHRETMVKCPKTSSPEFSRAR